MSAINPDSIVFVTGANGLIGSHVVDQLAARGFKVRAGVRGAQKSAWLPGLIAERNPAAPAVELVEIPDLAKAGALDDALKGVEGIALVASDLSFSPDAKTVIQNSVDSALEPILAATKISTVKRVVVTSSNVASYFTATMQEEVDVTSGSWSDWALQAAQGPDLPQTPQTSFLIYCASKVASEKATWDFVKNEKPAFNVATILPHQTTGQILAPKSQSGSSAAFFRGLFQGELGFLEMLPACNYVDVQDVARLHVAALVDPDVKNERLFAVGGTKSLNQILGYFRSHYPNRTFLEDFAAGTAGSQVDRSTIVEAGRAEEVLKRVNGGRGWKSLEDSIIENVADLA